MSDETTASTTEGTANEPAGEPGSLSGPEHATALGKAALNARITSQKQSEADKQARIAKEDRQHQGAAAQCLGYARHRSQHLHHQQRQGPPGRARSRSPTPTTPRPGSTRSQSRPTSRCTTMGCTSRSGEGSHTSYNQRIGALPDKPPSNDTIGEMILTGWLKELQAHEHERQETLDRLLGTASEISSGYNSCNEGALRNLGVRISALKPGDLPEPYAQSLAQVTTTLTKASPHVEAKLPRRADLQGRRQRVKMGRSGPLAAPLRRLGRRVQQPGPLPHHPLFPALYGLRDSLHRHRRTHRHHE